MRYANSRRQVTGAPPPNLPDYGPGGGVPKFYDPRADNMGRFHEDPRTMMNPNYYGNQR